MKAERQMMKTLLTLLRGGANAVGREVADRNALTILDQQLRDASVGLERAKRALALAIAQDQQEGARLSAMEKQIADLESRVVAALEGGREDLAREGAEAIARLEADRDAVTSARSMFATEIARLRSRVRDAEARIAAVDRGRRLARAAEAVRRVRQGGVDPAMPHQATLREAEDTLKRLRDRQGQVTIADAVLDELDAESAPATAAERLANEGFGAPVKATADDVLQRLKSRGSQPGAAN
jgi:phage shock protein A